MGRRYAGQSALRIRAQTHSELSQMEEGRICYQQPDGTRGSFPGIPEDLLEGIFFYDVQEGDLELSGWWQFWAEVIYLDGRKGIGEKRKVFLWS